MRLKDFIKAHRDSIPGSNDNEREQWVMNDEGLYLWAKREGCRI